IASTSLDLPFWRNALNTYAPWMASMAGGTLSPRFNTGVAGRTAENTTGSPRCAAFNAGIGREHRHPEQTVMRGAVLAGPRPIVRGQHDEEAGGVRVHGGVNERHAHGVRHHGREHA